MSKCLKAFRVATAILAPVAILGGLWQLWLMTKANQLAGEAASAAKASIDLAVETRGQQLRAYVFPKRAELKGLNDKGPLWARVTIRNSGQTPAQGLSIEAHSWWEKYPAPERVAGAMPAPENAPLDLPPGEEIYIDHKIEEVRRQELLGRKMTLHVSGVIRYEDVFNKKHESHFYFVQGGDYTPTSPQMSLAEAGNYSE